MFLDKWVLPINKDHDPCTDIIFYEEINNFYYYFNIGFIF